MLLASFFDYYPKDIESVEVVTLTQGNIWFMLAFSVILSVLVFIFSKQIKEWKHEGIVTKVIGVLLIVNVIGYYIWEGAHGYLDGVYTLPLTFCPMTATFTGITLITKKYWLFPYIYYMGIFGGIMASIFPDDLHAGPGFYRFYHFYIQHSLIIVMPVYLAKAYGVIPTFRQTLRGFAITMSIGFMGLIINFLTEWETVYALLNPYKPVTGTPLETISNLTNQSVIAYTLTAGILLFIAFMIIYSIPRGFNKLIKQKG